MYIEELELTQLRSFREGTIAFAAGLSPTDDQRRPNVTLLLGGNGSGKTTVLRAIALSVLGPILPHSGFVPYHLVRTRGPGTKAIIRAALRLHGEDLRSSRRTGGAAKPVLARTVTEIRRRGTVESVNPGRRTKLWASLFDESSPGAFIVGYGATRRVESTDTYDASLRRKSRILRYQRVAGLFEEQVTLTPLQTWLPQFRERHAARYKQFVALINRLLPPECDFTGQLDGDEYVYRFRGCLVPFGALSDGYRAYVGWITDLLYHVAHGVPNGVKLADIRGVVLVDEVDLHLHPEWQRSVVPVLADALPSLQFVFTTHSPVVAGTVQAANIVLLRVAPDGSSSIERSSERIHGLNAAQILSTPYFGLATSRAPDAVNTLSQLSAQVRNGDFGAALGFLEQLTGAKGASPKAAQSLNRALRSNKRLAPQPGRRTR